jgi:hypothetical protein
MVLKNFNWSHRSLSQNIKTYNAMYYGSLIYNEIIFRRS